MPPDDKTRIQTDRSVGVGTQLSGIYELDERIALGGMGEVYRGHNIQTGDPVAIKIVLPELARDETILSLFKKEASILNHLSHEAIVRYHVFTVDPGIGRPYLAMEFVNGVALIDFVQHAPLSPQDTRTLGLRVASGLAAAHRAGIIHRDLSPDNVILPGGDVENAKIIDFGIARSAVVGGKTLLEGKFAGKYNYVSPEQLGLYGGDVTERSDIYSLGLVLAAAARGEPLDMSGTQVEVIEKRRQVPDLSEIDDGLRPIVEAMLQPDPADRPAGMADIVRWLSPREATVPGTAAPSPSGARAKTAGNGATSVSAVSESPFGPYTPPPETPAADAKAKPAPEPAGKRKVTPVMVSLLAASVVAALGAGAYSLGLFGTGTPPAQERETPVAEEPLFEPEQQQSAAAPQSQPDEPSEPAATEPSTEASAEPAGPDLSEEEQAVSQEEPVDQQATLQSPEQPSQEQPRAEQEEAAVSETPPQSPVESAQQQAALQPADEPPSTPGARPGSESLTTAEEASQPEEEPTQQAAAAATAGVIGDVANRVSFIRNYAGDGCFYATATAVSEKTTEIEGFGQSVEPFTALLSDFENTFDIEPDIGARLIEPEQCVITDFLRGASNSSATPPVLTLDQTSVSNGTQVRGRIERLNGRQADVILIDHKGMAYSLNKHLAVADGTARFQVQVGLTASDLAENRTVPQVIVAVVSSGGIPAAKFDRPIRAEEILPRVLSQIDGDRTESTAVAKYFRLGG